MRVRSNQVDFEDHGRRHFHDDGSRAPGRCIGQSLVSLHHAVSSARVLAREGPFNRKDRLEHRLEQLLEIYSVSVGGSSVMDNHLHIVRLPAPGRLHRAEVPRWQVRDFNRANLSLRVARERVRSLVVAAQNAQKAPVDRPVFRGKPRAIARSETQSWSASPG